MKYKEFGYSYLGPLLFGFTKWLMDNFEKEEIQKVYFFSRDGLIMKKAFNQLFPNSTIQTYYLEVSRRSLRVPILWRDYSLENLFTMISPSSQISLKSIFDAVGLDIGNYLFLINQFGFTIETTFNRNDFLKNDKLRLLYSELSIDIENNSKNEYSLLKDYLIQYDIGGKFAIVDIGWSGGMQRFLQETLDELHIEHEIYGYYTGVASYYTRNIQNGKTLRLSGYLFDFSKNKNDNDHRSCFVGLYELLFLETKGSVKRYLKSSTEDFIYAERYPYEYLKDGKLLPIVSNIQDLQKGAIEYVLDNKDIKIYEKSPLIMCRNLLRIGQCPSMEVVRMFGDFPFFDEGEISYLAKPNNLLFYVCHFANFKVDLLKSRWKTGFFKRLLIVPLPYYSLYKILRRMIK